jgi:aminoglycoside phosphotransferase (APT) family kinase protein
VKVGDKEKPFRKMVDGDRWMDEERPDPNAILASLGFERPGSTEGVSGGKHTAIFRVELGDELFALRVFRPGEEGVARREARVMRAAREGGVPVPRVCAEGTWRDRAALLLSWCPGRPMAEELAARPWRAWRLGVLFGQSQAAIHGKPSPEALRAAGRAWIDWAGPGEEALAARLRETDPREDSLVHLDYHPLNVMTDGERITGVLDWTNTRAGDPRADYARTLTILRLDSGTGQHERAGRPPGVRNGVATRLPAHRGETFGHGSVLRVGRGGDAPRPGASPGSPGRHDGSRARTRPGLDGAVEEAGGMRRVTAGRVSTY